jgi:hypothetical protein
MCIQHITAPHALVERALPGALHPGLQQLSLLLGLLPAPQHAPPLLDHLPGRDGARHLMLDAGAEGCQLLLPCQRVRDTGLATRLVRVEEHGWCVLEGLRLLGSEGGAPCGGGYVIVVVY